MSSQLPYIRKSTAHQPSDLYSTVTTTAAIMQTAMVQIPIAMPAKAVTARRTAAPVSCTLRQDAARVAKAAGESRTGWRAPRLCQHRMTQRLNAWPVDSFGPTALHWSQCTPPDTRSLCTRLTAVSTAMWRSRLAINAIEQHAQATWDRRLAIQKRGTARRARWLLLASASSWK